MLEIREVLGLAAQVQGLVVVEPAQLVFGRELELPGFCKETLFEGSRELGPVAVIIVDDSFILIVVRVVGRIVRFGMLASGLQKTNRWRLVQ